MIKWVLLLVSLWALGQFAGEIFDWCYESRAIKAGYYCSNKEAVNPVHIDKCAEIENGKTYKEVFPEYFRGC